jgi:outer membrane receptor for ferrienterochelin and colicin
MQVLAPKSIIKYFLLFIFTNVWFSSFAQTEGNTGLLKGSVFDENSGEPITFANILISGTSRGTVSDEKGNFELLITPGVWDIQISFLGYEKTILPGIQIETGKSLSVEVYLVPTLLLKDEIVVTASQKPQTVVLAPASVGIVTEAAIQRKNITTFDQAFDEIPGIQVTRSSGANVQSFSIRGASEVAGGGIGNRILLLIDGRPALSPESGGALWNLVPVASIGRIEVVKGAYSSLYGSSAMGGVINVLTKKPLEKASTKVHLNYGFYSPAPESSGYKPKGDFNTMELSHSKKTKQLAYLVNLGRKANDGHREKSGYELINFYGKLIYDIDPERQIQFSTNINRIMNDSPASWLSRSKAYSVAPHRQDDYQDRREFNGDIHYTAIPNTHIRYSNRLYYYNNNSEFSFNDDPGNDSTNVNFGKQSIDIETVEAQRIGNVNQVDFYPNDNHYIIVGTDVKYDGVTGLPDTVLYGKHRALSLGAYIQDEINLNPNFIATIGIRYDYHSIIKEFTESNLSPKVALVYRLNDQLSIRTLFAQAFRNPPIAERYIKFTQGSGLRFQPNPDLKAENLNVSLEWGAKWNPSNRTSFDLSLFYNHYKNLISFQQVAQSNGGLLYKVINLNKALMQGMELSFQYRLPEKLMFRIGYTFLDARDISENRINDFLAYKAKHTLSFSSNYNLKAFQFNLNGRYKSAVKEVFIYPGSEPDAYVLFNGKLSYLIKDHYRLYFAMDNIGDTQYEELERYRMPGRSFTIGLNVEF